MRSKLIDALDVPSRSHSNANLPKAGEAAAFAAEGISFLLSLLLPHAHAEIEQNRNQHKLLILF